MDNSSIFLWSTYGSDDRLTSWEGTETDCIRDSAAIREQGVISVEIVNLLPPSPSRESSRQLNCCRKKRKKENLLCGSVNIITKVFQRSTVKESDEWQACRTVSAQLSVSQVDTWSVVGPVGRSVSWSVSESARSLASQLSGESTTSTHQNPKLRANGDDRRALAAFSCQALWSEQTLQSSLHWAPEIVE